MCTRIQVYYMRVLRWYRFYLVSRIYFPSQPASQHHILGACQDLSRLFWSPIVCEGIGLHLSQLVHSLFWKHTRVKKVGRENHIKHLEKQLHQISYNFNIEFHYRLLLMHQVVKQKATMIWRQDVQVFFKNNLYKKLDQIIQVVILFSILMWWLWDAKSFIIKVSTKTQVFMT